MLSKCKIATKQGSRVTLWAVYYKRFCASAEPNLFQKIIWVRTYFQKCFFCFGSEPNLFRHVILVPYAKLISYIVSRERTSFKSIRWFGKAEPPKDVFWKKKTCYISFGSANPNPLLNPLSVSLLRTLFKRLFWFHTRVQRLSPSYFKRYLAFELSIFKNMSRGDREV
jgi:hypothetical protein